jgi:hypothetical protein
MSHVRKIFRTFPAYFLSARTVSGEGFRHPHPQSTTKLTQKNTNIRIFIRTGLPAHKVIPPFSGRIYIRFIAKNSLHLMNMKLYKNEWDTIAQSLIKASPIPSGFHKKKEEVSPPPENSVLYRRFFSTASGGRFTLPAIR